MDEQLKLTQSWRDRVEGSWWKALVIIVCYVILRTVAESTNIGLGMAAMGDKFSYEQLIDPTKVMELMAKAGWFFHLQTAILCALLIGMVYLFKLKLFNLDKVKVKGFLFAFGMFALCFVVSTVYGLCLEKFVPSYVEPENQQLIGSLFGKMNPFFLYLSLAIFTPITEEILFRGLIMKAMFPLMPIVGALVSSVLFSAVHMPADIYQFFVYYILSIGLTYTYWKTRKLEYSIFFHILQNSVAFMGLMMQ